MLRQGFRNPTNQDQFIGLSWIRNCTTILGSSPDSIERFNQTVDLRNRDKRYLMVSMIYNITGELFLIMQLSDYYFSRHWNEVDT